MQQLANFFSYARDAANRQGVNVVPTAYALYNGVALPSLTVSGATATLDTTQHQFGLASLKLTAAGTTISVAFPSGTIPISAYQRWIASVFMRTSRTAIDGTLSVITANGTYSATITSNTPLAEWYRLWGDMSLIADTATACTLSLTLTGCTVGDTFNMEGWQLEQASGKTNLPSPFANSAAPGSADFLPDGNSFVRLLATNAAGNVAYNFKGIWSSSTAYVTGDETVYSGSYWLALQPSTGSAPSPVNLAWQVVGSYSGFQGAWSSTTTYTQGAEVTYAGNFWISTASNTNSAPTTSNANWQIAGPQSLDSVADGTTYARVLGTQLQLGATLKPGDGINVVSNGTFINNPGYPAPTAVGQGFAAGWIWGESNTPASFAVIRESPGAGSAASYPCDALIRLNTGVSIANGATIFASLFGMLHIPVSPNDIYSVSAFLAQDNNAATPAGVSVTVLAGLRFYDSNSNFISNLGATTPNSALAGIYSGTIVVPSNAAYAVAIAQLIIVNNSGATFSTGTSLYADARITAIQAVKQLPDQVALPQIAVLNYRAKYAPALSYSAAAGSPATATMTVGAATALIGSRSVSYGSMSVSVTGTGGSTLTYYLYFDDPAYAGGTPVLNATTNGNDCYASNGLVYAGQISVTFPTSGTSSGSGTGGTCVADDMWVCAGLRAGDALTGDAFDCVDFPSGQGKHVRRLIGWTPGEEACVRIVTDGGAVLVCSVSTPFDTPNGRTLYAPEMLGEEVLTDHGIERVTAIEHVGVRRVCRMHLGGVSYAAGENPTHRIYSHNATSKP